MTSKPLLIGLGYKRRRGKDTVANYLVHQHGFVRVACGDVIKDVLQTMFNLSEEQLHGDQKEVPLYGSYWDRLREQHALSTAPTPRWLAQRLGTEVGHQFSPDVWIEAALRRAPESARVVVSDVRYIEEAHAVRGRGGVLWRVDRDVQADPGQDVHASETGLDTWPPINWNAILDNDKSFEHLFMQVDQTLAAHVYARVCE